MTSPARPLPRSSAIWLLLLVFVAEFFLFDHFGSRRITSIYPRWNDQIQYLGESYTGYEFARVHGVAAGLWHTLVNPSAQGTLHDFAALLAFEIVGPSRSAALALNMLALIGWQAALFVVVRRRTGSALFAWMAAMLPLALRGPWQNEPGTAYDFRLDHLAMCAMGVTSAVALLTERFSRRRWAAFFGVATGVTLLTRFITGTYFVVIYLALAIWAAVAASDRDAASSPRSGRHMSGDAASSPRSGRQTSGDAASPPRSALESESVSNPHTTSTGTSQPHPFARRPTRRSALANFTIAALIATAIALPIFWLNREWVWNYYYIGHYIGPESAIRNQNFGLIRSVEYVFGWLGRRHLGEFFGWFAAAVTAALVVCRSFQRKPRPQLNGNEAPNESLPFAADSVITGLIFLLGPALVLTLHPQKSEVVLGALVPGVLLILIGVWSRILAGGVPSPRIPIDESILIGAPDSAAGPRSAPPATRVAAAVATLATLSVLTYFVLRQTVQFETPEAMAGFRQVNTLADLIMTKVEAAKLPVIRVAVDHITDALDAQVLRVVCYERHHVWKDWDMKLPTGIAEPDAATVRQRVADSDFVFLTDDGSTYQGYPYDKKLAAMRPELRAWCEAHLTVMRQFSFNGHPVTLYERRELAALRE